MGTRKELIEEIYKAASVMNSLLKRANDAAFDVHIDVAQLHTLGKKHPATMLHVVVADRLKDRMDSVQRTINNET